MELTIIIAIFVLLLLGPIRFIYVFEKNKSKIKFDLNNGEFIDFKTKYPELVKKHNELYEKTKKENKFIPLFILLIACFPLCYINWKFIFLVPILLCVLVFIAVKKDKYNLIKSLNKTYEKIFLDDILCKVMNIKKDNSFSKELPLCFETMSDSEFEQIEKEMIDRENIIDNIMKNTGKKCYKEYSIYYDLDCEVNNKYINIKKIGNYYQIKNFLDEYGEAGKPNLIYSFIGYIITINNYEKKDILLSLNEDFYYDKENKILYLIVSDETKNIFMASSGNNGMPNYRKTFDNDNWLQKKHNYFTQLRKYIEKFL